MRAFAALLVAIAPATAFAQQTPPPGQPQVTAPPVIRDRPVRGFVIDARGSLAKFGLRPDTATALGVQAADMPGPGLGITAGAHVYLLPLGRVVLGAGGEVMLTARSRQKIDDKGEPSGPLLKSRAFSVSPQVSLNFGRATGWSYVSAGYGVTSWETWNDAGDRPDRRASGLNYGGGARWFFAPHVAFSLDLRFYRMPAAEATPIAAARPGQRLLILSAGFSLK
jgi:opacity protein-like surface antigen